MTIPALRDTFKSVDTSSLVDKVEASLVELLLERKLRVGDVIPKEIELSEALGVSRTVIREALTRLRLMGLIESKKEKGFCYYKPRSFRNDEQEHEPSYSRPGYAERNL